jgi:hypothetical protein
MKNPFHFNRNTSNPKMDIDGLVTNSILGIAKAYLKDQEYNMNMNMNMNMNKNRRPEVLPGPGNLIYCMLWINL